MKRKLSPTLMAMSAACALVVNVANTRPAHAQGMPDSARDLIRTMRPMATTAQMTTKMPAPADPNADAYGGAASGKSESARGPQNGPCAATDSHCEKPAP